MFYDFGNFVVVFAVPMLVIGVINKTLFDQCFVKVNDLAEDSF